MICGAHAFKLSATGSCRAVLGWTAEGGCPYAEGREHPSPH